MNCNFKTAYWVFYMKLEAQNGDSFELRILGYQYPSGVKYYWDLNWLKIQIIVTRAGKSWIATDPSILTREIPPLIAWFRNIHYGNTTSEYIGFMEPTLYFRRVKLSRNVTVIRVYIDYELLPKWYRGKRGNGRFFVQFPIAQIDLLGAAESLGSQLALYPERQEFHSTLDEDYDDTEGKV